MLPVVVLEKRGARNEILKKSQSFNSFRSRRRAKQLEGGEGAKLSRIAFGTRNKLDKVVIVGGSNNAGVWRRSPQSPEANGGSWAEPQR